MDLAGEILKKRREDLGRDIQEIADLLKIRADYLRAIEEDAFAQLPAPVYTTGYIRCYARYLDIDADSIVRYYEENLSRPRPSTIVPIAFSRKKSPKILYAVLILLVAAAAFFFANHIRQRPHDRAVAAPPKPPPVEGVPAVVDAVPQRGGRPVPEKHSLVISAIETTWMHLQLGDGRGEEVLLRPGESKNWNFSGSALLKVGNAGGVQIRFDGRDLERPGSRGQVVTLTLPPDR